ncbi:MAG: CotH kinase family protein [Oscillospiraceae bacterium]|nr:CotH kinase family protein [Oscillospiraceae bacterium]
MLDRRNHKVIVFLCALLALVFAIGAFLFLERQYCMDVPLILESNIYEYTKVSTLDISQLRFNGEKIAADIANNTIYISQASDKLSHYSSLQGELKSTNPAYTLFFLKNTALNDISSAVESGTPLSLVIVEEDLCQLVNVVITTLPVINIDGAVTHQDEERRAVYSGFATIWSGFDPSTEAYSTISSDLQWHVRGNSAAAEPKNPWKLSFKNERGENKNVELVGLGRDDDWILNSLTMDDTRIKEKLFMDLWNIIAAGTDYNYKMSSGEYVEAVINGKYMGVFLLQRRLDAKYLELSDEDVLLKVTHYQATSAEEAYEFVTPKVNAEEIYTIMQRVFEGKEPSSYNLYNVIDVNLMLQLASARDNFSLKNMYHVLKKTDDGYAHFLVPWDTDQSFGVVWKAEYAFCYDYQMSLGEFGVRMETPALQKTYPEYQQKAIERWNNLRQTILTEENILAHIDELYGKLSTSGAIARDISVWSNRYGGDDTVSALKAFVCARLAFVDKYYN